MINLFLKAKHWQIFIPLFAIPLIFQFIAMGFIVSKISQQSDPNIEFIFDFFSIFPLFIIPILAVFYGWMWSVAVGIGSKLPENLRLHIGRFKIFFFFPLVYTVAILIFMTSLMNGMINLMTSPNFNHFGYFGVIFVLHLFAMFCNIYCFYFMAKTIKTAELKRKLSFGDFVGEFFLIWFFIVGVWILQPKINKMLEEELV